MIDGAARHEGVTPRMFVLLAIKTRAAQVIGGDETVAPLAETSMRGEKPA